MKHQKRGKKTEGYWYSESEPEYPMPIADILLFREAEEIFRLIFEKEKTAKKVSCLGCSSSRLTGEIIGNSEFETDEWVWPEDFAPHYVRQHRVKPSDEFLEYIGYKLLSDEFRHFMIYNNGKFVTDVYSFRELQQYFERYSLYGKLTYEEVK